MSTDPTRSAVLSGKVAEVATERLPQVVLDAMDRLDPARPNAPLAGEVATWAEERLSIATACGHRAQVDPRTFDLAVAPEDRDAAEVEHFLWALTDGEPPCQIAGPFLNDWADSGPLLWAISDPEEALAVRLVVRTVQYVEAGVSPARNWHWLKFGATPDTVVELRRLARREGRNLDNLTEQMLESLRTIPMPVKKAGQSARLTATHLETRACTVLDNILRDNRDSAARRIERDKQAKATKRARRQRGSAMSRSVMVEEHLRRARRRAATDDVF